MNIAVVEDNFDIGLLWRMSFEGDGDTVHLTNNVEDAILNIPWDTVDAAIVDYQLGTGANGGVLIDWLDENHPNILVVLVTALAKALLPEHLRGRVINKPTSTAELRAAMDTQRGLQ